MKGKFTYKELTVLLGILVAAIIMITLWIRPVSPDSVEVSEKPVRELAKPTAQMLLKRTFVLVIDLLQ